MGWALTVDGRLDRAAILMLVEDREEAESIAHEIRRNGTPIVVRPYREPAVGPSPSTSASGSDRPAVATRRPAAARTGPSPSSGR